MPLQRGREALSSCGRGRQDWAVDRAGARRPQRCTLHAWRRAQEGQEGVLSPPKTEPVPGGHAGT